MILFNHLYNSNDFMIKGDLEEAQVSVSKGPNLILQIIVYEKIFQNIL